MKLLTGNDLASGDVTWWTGKGWSRHIGEAVDVGEEGDAILAREEKALNVNVPYLIDATLTDNVPLPNHIKDRIRACGPTVRMDLAINSAIPIVKA